MKSFSHFYVWTLQRPARENLFSHTDILRPTHGKIPSSFFLLTTSKNFETHPYPRLTSTSFSPLLSSAARRRWRARQRAGDIRHQRRRRRQDGRIRRCCPSSTLPRTMAMTTMTRWPAVHGRQWARQRAGNGSTPATATADDKVAGSGGATPLPPYPARRRQRQR